jgi:hypothetical protein
MWKHRGSNTRPPPSQSGAVIKLRCSWWATLGSATPEHGISWNYFSRNLVQNNAGEAELEGQRQLLLCQAVFVVMTLPYPACRLSSAITMTRFYGENLLCLPLVQH